MSPVLAQARRWAPRLLALALLIIALQRAGIQNVMATVMKADPGSVGLAAVLVLPFLIARAARWQALLRDYRVWVSLAESTRLYAIGVWLGMVTPGQAGDAVKAWYLRDRGESLAVGLLSCFLDRLFDVLILAVIGTTAVALFLPGAQTQWLLGAAMVGGVLAVLLLLARPGLRGRVVMLPGLRQLWEPLQRRLVTRPWGQALLDSGLRLPTLSVALLLTVLGFAVTLSRVYLVFHAVGIDLPLLTFLAVASITVFASLISVAGIGSREVALIALLAPLGYLEQQAVAASVLILFLNLTNIGPGLVAWLARPVRLSNADAGT